MSKHTPGPWDIGYAQGDDIVIVGLERMVEICTVWSDPDVCDARLIAAAPDLLAALKGLHDDIMDYIRLNSLGAENNHWLVQARAAIAKATNEQA